MNDITITQDGEVVETMTDFSAMPAIIRAEIDVQIATARKYPRNVPQVLKDIKDMATLDEETAAECLYVLVRGQKKQPGRNQPQREDDRENKPIEGPSIRLAEIAAQIYGNCRVSARVIEVNRQEKYVEAEGIFHDLQSNSAQRATVRRRISTKTGHLFSDDMIVVTGNAACSIAKRNAILAGIPRALYRPAYDAARKMVAGDQTTLVQRRDKAFRAWKSFGITTEQLLAKLGLESVDDITPDHIATLRGLWATITNGESTVEDVFAAPAQTHDQVADPLADKAAPAEAKPSEAVAEKKDPAAPVAENGDPDAQGYEARKRGISRKAVPPEYRTEDQAEKAQAWQAGWDRRDAEEKAGQ